LTDQALDDLARRIMLDAARREYGGLMTEPPEHTFSPDFERGMEKLIRRADHPARLGWIWVRRAAAVLAALLLLASAVAVASGYNLLELLTQWTAEQFSLAPGQIDYADPDDLHIPEGTEEYAGIQEALSAYGVDRPVAPHRLPEGFELAALVVDDQGIGDMIIFHALYRRGEDILVQQVNVYLEQESGDRDSFGHFQKDEGAPAIYRTGGVDHLLATNAGRPIALWANGPAECAVSGDITMEELTEMLDSIYE